MAAARTRRTKRPRMGRPPHPPEKRRHNRVVTFVTDSELAQLERMAGKRDETLSALVHGILKRSLSRRA